MEKEYKVSYSLIARIEEYELIINMSEIKKMSNQYDVYDYARNKIKNHIKNIFDKYHIKYDNNICVIIDGDDIDINDGKKVSFSASIEFGFNSTVNIAFDYDNMSKQTCNFIEEQILIDAEEKLYKLYKNKTLKECNINVYNDRNLLWRIIKNN